MNQTPTIPGISGLHEIGRTSLVVGYKGKAGGITTVVEVLLTDDDENRREFHRSSAMQSRMANPGMPPIQQTGLIEARPYRIREFVEGRPASGLFTDGPMTEERIVTTGRALASTLSAMHRRGMVHTEVHPHGLRVESSGLVRFTDTGRAWPVNRPLPESERHLSVPYRAPEYRAGEPARTESDIYALGAVLVAFAIGKPPSKGFAYASLQEHAEPLCPALRVLLRSMLEKDPGKRPEAHTILDCLQKVGDLNALLKLKSWRPRPSITTFSGHHAYPLIGRKRELSELMGLWQKVSKGIGLSVTILGPSGSGRHRLVEELKRGVERTGGIVVRHSSEADSQRPTLIINLSHKGQQGHDPNKPWLSVNFANTGPIPDQHTIELKELEAADCAKLAQAYLASPTCQGLHQHLVSKGTSLPGELLGTLNDWCEQGVLKPARGKWRFEPYDAIGATPAEKKGRIKPVPAGLKLDASEVLSSLMKLWPTNLEQDEPIPAGLKSLCTALECRRVDLFRLEQAEHTHLQGSSLGEFHLDEELLEKVLLRFEPAHRGAFLLLPLRYGYKFCGLLNIQWWEESVPKIDSELIEAVQAVSSPYALMLGAGKDEFAN